MCEYWELNFIHDVLCVLFGTSVRSKRSAEMAFIQPSEYETWSQERVR